MSPCGTKPGQSVCDGLSTRGKKGRIGLGKLPTPKKGRASDKAARATGKKRRG
jgi:hypothetical protein